MSFGKAIISSDIDVLKEIISKDNSILVPYNEIDKWVSAIELLNIMNV